MSQDWHSDEPTGLRNVGGGGRACAEDPRRVAVLYIREDLECGSLEVEACLSRAGYEVHVLDMHDFQQSEVASGKYKLVLLDICVPDGPGYRVCRRLRTEYELPLMVILRDEARVDALPALVAGADTYIRVPFHPAEFVARVGALLRR